MKEKVISVLFSSIPEVKIRVISNDDSITEKRNKKQYPFELQKSQEVFIETTKRNFKFTIYKGYTWNGADIPRLFWRVIGSRTDNDFLIASMIHDYLLEFKVYMVNEVLNNSISPKEYRRLTSLIFRHILKAQGTNTIKANVMSFAVQFFQMTVCAKEWEKCQ